MIRERLPTNVLDRWIAEHVRGLTFCDIGGIGLSSKNERISTAVRNGAKRTVMIDLRTEEFRMWKRFHETMAAKGISDYECLYGVNLESPTLLDEIGRFDFVFSTGILYHAPSPVFAVWNLARIATQFLIVNTVTVPSVIENERGRLETLPTGVLFLPALRGNDREILKLHWMRNLDWSEQQFDNLVPDPGDTDAIRPYIQNETPTSGHFWTERGGLSYTPYWWVFHEDAFRALARTMGFEILEEYNRKGHALNMLCRRVRSDEKE